VVLVRSARPFYGPDQVRIRAGESVRWVNDRLSDVHSVVETGSGRFSVDLPPGQSFAHRFDRPGRYAYSCRFHPWMRGEVVVDPARVEGRLLSLPEALWRARLLRGGLLLERAPRPVLARLWAGGVVPSGPLPCQVDPEVEPAVDPAGTVWLAAEGGRALVGLTPGAGACRKRALDARVGAVAAADDGALWIHDRATGRLGEVRRAGGGVRWHARAGFVPGPARLAVDGLGRVWTVGQAGEVSVFRAAGSGGGEEVSSRWSLAVRAASFALSPDGSLWLADVERQKVLRLEPGRDIAELGAPGLAAAEPALAVAADGAVWFAHREPGRIGRIDGGAAEELEVAPRIERAAGIAAGGPGRLWLLDAAGRAWLSVEAGDSSK
jgi:streptogramin lyase